MRMLFYLEKMSHNFCTSFKNPQLRTYFQPTYSWGLYIQSFNRYAFSICQVLDMEKAMAPHSSTLAWKIPWTEEPGALQSMRWLGVGHDWATSLSLFIFIHWRRKWQPTPVCLPGESQGWEAWWAAVYGVTQSRTRLKWRSSSKQHFLPTSYPSLRSLLKHFCQVAIHFCWNNSSDDNSSTFEAAKVFCWLYQWY